MPLSARLITSALAEHNAARRILIGYSGGVDSHVLLHLCATIPALKPKLTAVYIHHGLQLEADAWAGHCGQTARALDVDFKILRVNAAAKPGESPEEAARNARYAALKSLMLAGDVLLVAQHREDQLETVLLQLFRGGGLRGLSGMPRGIAFGPGALLRPLLDVAKQAIDDYAKAQHLSWIEDPSNQRNDYDRNFLRNTVVPLLKQRWPGLDKTVARSAGHCRDAQLVIDEIADDLMLEVFNPADGTLNIRGLSAHPPLRQKLLIRQWFRYRGLKMPAQIVVERIQSDILAAREDSDPLLTGPGYRICRYRNRLYCLPPLETEQPLDARWNGQTPLRIAPRQMLVCMPSSAGILREDWERAHIEVRFRSGGEKIRLPKREGRHALKKLFQEAGVPPWERKLMPLVYLDDKLAAVGERWISADFYHEQTNACIELAIKPLR